MSDADWRERSKPPRSDRMRHAHSIRMMVKEQLLICSNVCGVRRGEYKSEASVVYSFIYVCIDDIYCAP